MVNNGKGLSVDGIKEMRGGEYVLDGYITLANPKVFKDENGMEYSIQYYQKKHLKYSKMRMEWNIVFNIIKRNTRMNM